MPICSLIPHSQTIFRARPLAILMSHLAPLVTALKTVASTSRRPQRRFVDPVRELRAGITGRAARDDGEIDILADLHFLRVSLKNFLAAFHVGKIDRDLPIEAPWTQ